MRLLHCLLNRHEADRNRVRPVADGSGDLTGQCRHCRGQIGRHAYRDWRRESGSRATGQKLSAGS